MKNILCVTLLLLSTSAFTQELTNYGVLYNNTTLENEIWVLYDDGTDERVASFAFNSGYWAPGNSFTDQDSGILWLKDSDGTYVTFNPATDTLTKSVPLGTQSYQSLFPTAYIDETIQTVTDTAGNVSTQVGTNQIIDSDGDTMISTETNADGDEEIHIGENSLVTVETDGVQQLWAEDASGNAIDINVKEGTNLLINGTNVASSIASNSNAIGMLDSRMDSLENLVQGYSEGLASSIAMSQFDLGQDGFSVGVGMGRYQNVTETAIGFGYGRELANGRRINFRMSSASDSSGLGFSMTF
jgi:hypothetical protein